MSDVWRAARADRTLLYQAQRVHALSADQLRLRGQPPPDRAALIALLSEGEIEVVGRLTDATNATFVCQITRAAADGDGPELGAIAVYKPRRGERPLADFPVGTLGNRERAAFLLSETTGWDIVPPTVARDGPLGPGVAQAWIETDDRLGPLELVLTSDARLRKICLFDALANNADRKGSHLLPVSSGHIYGVDHGICFHRDPKLRTVLWAWRGTRISESELSTVRLVSTALDAELGAALRELLSAREVDATIERVQGLIESCLFPEPDPRRPAVPWPPF